jgi:hypothetical protein
MLDDFHGLPASARELVSKYQAAFKTNQRLHAACAACKPNSGWPEGAPDHLDAHVACSNFEKALAEEIEKYEKWQLQRPVEAEEQGRLEGILEWLRAFQKNLWQNGWDASPKLVVPPVVKGVEATPGKPVVKVERALFTGKAPEAIVGALRQEKLSDCVIAFVLLPVVKGNKTKVGKLLKGLDKDNLEYDDRTYLSYAKKLLAEAEQYEIRLV